MAFEEKYSLIKEIGELIEKNDQSKSKILVEGLILPELTVDTKSEDLLAHIMAESLLKRIDRQLLESKNIYLQEFDIPQIELFYKMLLAYPQVSTSHSVANQYLLNAIKGYKKITLLDIGIGKGKQIAALLGLALEQKFPLEEVTIIGLDPDPSNVEDSGTLFETFQSESGIAITYVPITNLIENFTEDDFKKIAEMGGDHLFVNSAFTLHHIAHPLGDNEYRTTVLSRIRELNPRIFTLSEPNSDHDTENLSKRLFNCWHHFGKVFQLIDAGKIENSHKYLIKEMFFGREIRNIFGVSDYLRSERHESSDSWMLRLAKAGFVPVDYKDISVTLNGDSDYKISEGFVELGYQKTPLIGVFAYRPGN